MNRGGRAVVGLWAGGGAGAYAVACYGSWPQAIHLSVAGLSQPLKTWLGSPCCLFGSFPARGSLVGLDVSGCERSVDVRGLQADGAVAATKDFSDIGDVSQSSATTTTQHVYTAASVRLDKCSWPARAGCASGTWPWLSDVGKLCQTGPVCQSGRRADHGPEPTCSWMTPRAPGSNVGEKVLSANEVRSALDRGRRPRQSRSRRNDRGRPHRSGDARAPLLRRFGAAETTLIRR